MPTQGYAQVNHNGPTLGHSKGVVGTQRSESAPSVYCFNLAFTPKVAVASGHINNNATVGTALGSSEPTSCPEGFRDAAAKTYAANDPGSTPRNDLSFGIVFMR